jgi:hypothetical protein
MAITKPDQTTVPCHIGVSDVRVTVAGLSRTWLADDEGPIF